MAHCKIIDGEDTLQRIEAAYDKLRANGKPMSVAAFCRQAKVSYHTLTHRYKFYADKVRKFRDKGLPRPPKRSPATWPRDRITDHNEAAHLITILRKENRKLAEARDRSKAIAERLIAVEAQNERLRGALVVLRQWFLDHMEPTEAQRTLKAIEESVPDLTSPDQGNEYPEESQAPLSAA